jgi:selenide,water dikinase
VLYIIVLFQIVVATRGEKLLGSHNSKVQQIFKRILNERDVEVRYGAEVTGVEPSDAPLKDTSRLVLSEKSTKQEPIPFHECLWCTSAGAAPWLSEKTPFDTDDNGFLTVRDTYQSTSHCNVFAAGDCCMMEDHPRPKAGVFAVRAGPPLKENLVAFLLKGTLTHHKPQSTFLGLISTGDKYAVASKGSLAMEGAYLWTWKDSIDRKWMDMYQTLPKMDDDDSGKSAPPNVAAKGAEAMAAFSAATMRCGGCGAKVGATTVSRVLDAVRARRAQDTTDGAASPGQNGNYPNSSAGPIGPIDYDDAAVIPLPKKGGGAMIQTIDFFRSFIGDPYIFGKIAAGT